MTHNELTRRFPKASAAFIAANLSAGAAEQAAKLECHTGNEPLGAKEVQGSTGQRFLVRITAHRKRLIDEDNLCEKYLVDLLRYARVIPDDAPGVCKIEVSQKKVGKGQPEKTIIEVFHE